MLFDGGDNVTSFEILNIAKIPLDGGILLSLVVCIIRFGCLNVSFTMDNLRFDSDLTELQRTCPYHKSNQLFIQFACQISFDDSYGTMSMNIANWLGILVRSNFQEY